MATALTLALLLVACLPPDLPVWPGGTAPPDEDDQDGDGVLLPDDCDDEDPQRHPGATEACGNAIDEDCDEVDPACRLAGEITAPDDCFLTVDDIGWPVTLTDDLDGDGLPEVALGGGGDYGKVALHRIQTEGAPAFDPNPWYIPSFTGKMERFGWALAPYTGDLTGDGLPDLLVGAQDRTNEAQNLLGGAFLLYGAFFEGTEWGGQSYTFTGDTVDQIGPHGSLATGDFDGDGSRDVALGASSWALDPSEKGAVVVLWGPIAADRDLGTDLGTTGVRLTGVVAGDQLGETVSAFDLDGDGADELLVGTRGSGASPAEVYVVSLGARPTSERGITAFPHVRIRGTRSDEGADPADPAVPLAVLGMPDVDGDLLPDLAVGAPLDGAAGAGGPGAVLLFSGDLVMEALESGADLDFQDAIGHIAGEADLDRLGDALAAADIDGDGRSDLVVGAPGRNGEEGGAYLVHAWEWATVAGAAELVTRIAPPAEWHGFGGGVAAGDVTGDGYGDVLVASAPHGWHNTWLLGGGPGSGTAGIGCD